MVYPERLQGIAAQEPPPTPVEKNVKRKTANADKSDTNSNNRNVIADADDKNDPAEETKNDELSEINFSTDFFNLISGKEAAQIDNYKQQIHQDIAD